MARQLAEQIMIDQCARGVWYNERVSRALDHLRMLAYVRRRWVVWRAIECAGIGSAMGAAVAFFVLVVLAMRGEDSIVPVSILLGVGAAAGTIWGLSRRPTLLQTAMLIDRRLGLHDLLSTSMSKQMWMDEEFGAVVIAQALARCRTISMDDLLLRRLGARQWGGIGIAAGLVLVGAMFTGELAQNPAQAKESSGGVSNPGSISPIASGDRTTLTTGKTPVQSGRDRSLKEDEDASDSAGRPVSDRAAGRNRVGAGDGTGATAGTTPDANIAPLRQGDGSAKSASAGDGVANEAGNVAGNPAAVKPAAPTPPWETTTWPADAATADKKLETGQIPAEYRELIRGFFLPGRTDSSF